MKRVFFVIFAALLLFTVPVLASDEEPAPDPDEYQAFDEPSCDGQYEQLYAELVQLRANTDYIFLGVIALSGVVLGCYVGITLIRLWGA